MSESAHNDDEPRDPLDLLAEEFLALVRKGDNVTPEGFASSHPEHRAELRDLCETLLMLEGCKRERETSATGGRKLVVPMLERLGDYRIVREVGRGGMGVVFEAVQESLDRRVALKVLPQASLLSGNQLERFRREAQTAARLHHTHIVPVFDSGEADGLHFYAMQFIDGEGLDAIVKSMRKQESGSAGALRDRCRLVARVGAEVAEALHHAHQHGALHRDVKPANLMLDREGHVWVTDFGLAKALEQNGLTNTGDVLGTLQYMAPEQFEGRYDARSEVYALGATLYEVVCLRSAYVAETRAELIEQIRGGKHEPLRRIAPSAASDLETILARAMDIDPDRRYPTAAEFASDLRAFLEDRPIAARRQSGLELFWAWCRRNRALASAGAVAALAVATTAVVGWTSYWTTRGALEKAQRSESQMKLASERDRANLADSLQVFEDVFDTIVGPDPLDALVEDGAEIGSTVAAMPPPVDAEDLALLERMLDFYDKFAERNVDNVALRQQTARSYARVGAIQQRLGRAEEAVAAYERAAALLREVPEREQKAELAAVLQELGQAQVRRGQPRLAAACYAESLSLLGDPGESATRNEKRLTARAHYLLATAPGFRESRDGGRRPPSSGRPPEERPGMRRPGAREPRQDPRRPVDGDPHSQRRQMNAQGFEELRQQLRGHLEAAQRILDGLLATAPDDSESKFLKARCLLVSARRGPRADAAEDPAVDAVKILTELVAAHPDNDSYRFELCDALMPRSRIRGTASPPPSPSNEPSSPSDISRAVEEARILVARRPDHVEYQAALARALSAMGARLHDADQKRDPKSGIAQLEEALAIHVAIRKGASKEPRFLLEQAQTMRRLLRAKFDAGDIEGARQLGREAATMLSEASREGVIPQLGEERMEDFPQTLERLGLPEFAKELLDADRRRR